MKSILKVAAILLAFIFSASCNNDSSKKQIDPRDTMAKALTQDKSDTYEISSSRGQSNLVDDIYKEMVSKNAKLQKLEDDIERYQTIQIDSMLKYDKYKSKSIGYYASADNNTKQITDSVLRKEIQQIIAKNKADYEHMISGQTALIDQLAKTNSNLDDSHAVLKLLITLPVINQYQNTQLPNDKELHVLLSEKQKLIERTKKLTPKH
jgi:hypothetical protein